jgi:hypothetical protein
VLRLAGDYRGNLAQGSAFAADARVRADVVPRHSIVATQVFCGTTPEDVSRLVTERRPDPSVEGELPAYEVWRQRLANEFVSLGGVNT